MKATAVTAGLAMALGLATRVTAADCQTRIALTPTTAGRAIDASGRAEVRSRDGGARQDFKLRMDAAVADGTTFRVFANGRPAGTLTIVLGNGELEVNNDNGQTLPAGLDPVCSIGPVLVTNATGTVAILFGSFVGCAAADTPRAG